MKTSDPFSIHSSLPIELEEADVASEFHLELEGIDTDQLEEREIHQRSAGGILAVLVLSIAALAFQAFYLQVTRATESRIQAQGNSVRILTKQPERGLITDFNGKIIGQNDRQLALAINPQTLPKTQAERKELYTLLEKKVQLSEDQIAFIEKNRQRTPDPFPIKTNLSKDESLLYQEWFATVPGITVMEIPTRKYLDIASMGQLLGYTGRVTDEELARGYALNQRVGRAGVEQNYNDQLTGTPGKVQVEVNAQGEEVRPLQNTASTAAVQGKTLRLSIDSRLQQVVADALTHELERRTQKYGPLPKLGASAMVIDTRDGSVRAMVSLPSFSSQLFAKGISSSDYTSVLQDPGNPLLNRAIQGTFMPGSTLKPLVASAGLQAGVIGPNTTMDTPEAITIGSFRFPDWKYHGHTNTRKAIAESNNIFFYSVGGGWAERNITGLGIDRLRSYLDLFGLGKPTGIDLPAENGGLLPSPEWKEKTYDEAWYIGNTYQMSIGQGYLLTTPLQMANATAAIANGGTLWEPHIGHSLIDPITETETVIPPKVVRQGFISSDNLKVVREGMRQAVESGSARPLNKLAVASAGKTGTAQFGNQGLTHAWYTGFAPYENPEMAFSIIIEGGGESFYSSVPVAEEILRGYFNEPLQEGQQPFSVPGTALISQIAAEYSGER